MAYPGRVVQKGDSRSDVVSAVQARLVAVGCGPLDDDGIFGDETESAVMLFQTRRNLDPDGVVGPLTWSELFVDPAPVNEKPGTALLGQALTAAKASKVANPVVKTAGVLAHWARSPIEARIYAKAAFDDPSLIRPGAIFIVDHGSGKGTRAWSPASSRARSEPSRATPTPGVRVRVTASIRRRARSGRSTSASSTTDSSTNRRNPRAATIMAPRRKDAHDGLRR